MSEGFDFASVEAAKGEVDDIVRRVAEAHGIEEDTARDALVLLAVSEAWSIVRMMMDGKLEAAPPLEAAAG